MDSLLRDMKKKIYENLDKFTRNANCGNGSYIRRLSDIDKKAICYFIEETLVNREKEIAEEVEKLKLETLHEKHNGTGDPCWKCHYDLGEYHAYQDVLDILKHQ